MNKIITYRSLLFLALGISSFNLSGNLKEAENPRGWAKVKFGKVGNEEQVTQTSGTRKIAGIYPHLTTYSQSRKDGRFFKACLLYTSPSPRDLSTSRMPSSA